MISMTGYGYREYRDGRVELITEIKSYNNRYLDISVNSPPFLSFLEPVVTDFLRERLGRGRVDVTFRVKELEEDIRVHIDVNTAGRYAEALRDLAKAANLDDEPRLSHFLHLEGVINQVKNRKLDWFESLAMEQLKLAYQEFAAVKIREGRATAKDIERLLERVKEHLGSVERHAEELEKHLRENLEQRFRDLVGERIDENRLYQEIALMLVRYGIDEETVRMRSHLSQFEDLLGSKEGIGKKLDFICQELNREINTIGSKSTLAEINRSVVEMKDALEKIREQLRNVE
jgi:uncharacterized protein (TIGR00255 family)